MINFTGKLLRITQYTSNATWTKKDDVGSVLVKCVGGGGGSGGIIQASIGGVGGTGGTSSFGSYVSALGGSGGRQAPTASHGVGGLTTNADVSIQGESRAELESNGYSHMLRYGRGGRNTSDANTNGGAGGYAEKAITSGLSETVAVTVGAGGAGGSGSTAGTPGGSGVVIVYEFAK